MQTPVASTEIRGSRSTWVWEMPFLTATAVPLFLQSGGRFYKCGNLKENISLVVSDVSLKTGPNLCVGLAAVY